MQDLTIYLDEGVLNCRAAAIIKHNGKILFHKNVADNHYALIGGRVQITESSDDTIKREILEELGKEIELTGYIGTVENFFEHKGKNFHEIMFVHQAEFVNEEDKKITETMFNIEKSEIEAGKNIQYEWVDIDKLDEFNIRPAIIKKVLKDGIFPVHVINKETIK